jgi:hypothetical protein
MASLSPSPTLQFFDSNGDPLVGGKLYTYTAGTTTPKTTYTDSAGAVPNANPIILDSRGEADIYLATGPYKYVLKDANEGPIWTQDNIEAVSADSLDVGFTPAGTGAVTRTLEDKLRDVVHVADFGASASASGNANTTAIQNALNHIKSNSGTLHFGTGIKYPMSGVITLIETVSNSLVQTWVIQGNGATLDWSASALTTGSLLKIGATGIPQVHETGICVVRDLKILGPETQNCTVSGGIINPTPDGTTVGIELNCALDVSLENIIVRRCYKGFYYKSSWPLNTYNCHANACYIGHHYGSMTTLGTHVGDSAESAAYALLLCPDADDEVVDAQTFINFRAENSLRGITLDPRDLVSVAGPRVRHIEFINPRFEQVAYDLLRMGQAWVYSSPSTAGADRTNYTQNIGIRGGEWDDPISSGYAIRCSANGSVRGVYGEIPVGVATSINGGITFPCYTIMPGPNGGTQSGKSYQGPTEILGDFKIGQDYGGDTVQWNSTAVSCPNNISFDTSVLHVNGTSDWVGVGTISRIQGVETFINKGITAFYNASSAGGSLGIAFYSNVGGTGTKVTEFSNNGDIRNVNNVYGAISDIKLKENITPARNYLDDLCKLNVVRFSYKTQQSDKPTQLGLIAQEVEEIFPGLVDSVPDTELKEETNEKGEIISTAEPTGTVTKSVKYSVLVPMLLTAVKELNEKIIKLEQAT